MPKSETFVYFKKIVTATLVYQWYYTCFYSLAMHFFVLKSLVFYTPEKVVGLTMCNFVTEVEKVLIDYFVTISLAIEVRTAEISFSKGKIKIGKFSI